MLSRHGQSINTGGIIFGQIPTKGGSGSGALPRNFNADEPSVRLFGSAFVTLRDHRNGNNFGVQTFPWTVANDGIQRLLIGTAEGCADYIARCRDQTEILAV